VRAKEIEDPSKLDENLRVPQHWQVRVAMLLEDICPSYCEMHASNMNSEWFNFRYDIIVKNTHRGSPKWNNMEGATVGSN